jgi:hypothetical protein
LIFISFFVLTGCLNNSESEAEVKRGALQYLKEKYNKEFVILKINKNLETSLYTIRAAPIGMPKKSLVFIPMKTANTEIII